MKTYTSLIASILALMLPAVESFSVLRTVPKRRISVTPLALSSTILSHDMDMDDESTYRYLLSKARDCAFSEGSTAQDAKRYLMQILELESDCVSGNLKGEDMEDICNNVDDLAVIVSHLREKVDQKVVVSPNDVSAALSMGALVAFSLLFAGLSEFRWQQDVTTVPFTFDEWIMAAKGGYMNTMVAHLIRNGGL